MTTLDRRAFLARAAAVPLVYGLADLEAGAGQGGPEPAWVGQALARMKETGRWGVVLTVPPEKERVKLGISLWALTAFENEDNDAHALFCEAVFIVMPAELARARFGPKGPFTRLLLSPEGKLLASDEAELSVVDDSSKFAASFRAFLHGEGNVRLAERAAAVEKGLPAEVKEAIAKLGSTSVEEGVRAKLVLARKAEGITPLLAHLAETGVDETTRLRARNLLTSYYASLRPEAPGARLPYGCSGPHSAFVCRGCGMARIPERSRMFFRFLVPGEPPPKDEND